MSKLIWRPEALIGKVDSALPPAARVSQAAAVAEAPKKTRLMARSIKVFVKGRTAFIGVFKGPARRYVFAQQGGAVEHDITVKKARALSWSGAGHPVAKVRHPGNKPTGFMDAARRVFPVAYLAELRKRLL